MATAPVPGVSAGRWDLRRRLAQLATVLLVAVVVALVVNRSVPTAITAAAFAVLAVAAAVASLVFARRVTVTMALEREAGYSTMIDAAGYDLRDFRTLEVLRPREVAPNPESRRSLALGIFGVKPGTVLAKRLDDEKR